MDCDDFSRRFICFNAASNRVAKEEALVRGNNAVGFDRFTILSAFLALATLTVGLAMNVVKLTNKVKNYEEKLNVVSERSCS